jgi:hypothetical protein
MTLTAARLDAYLADPVLLIAEQLVMESGQTFGEVMAPFQRAFFQAVFSTRPDGSPVHRLVYDERRRGESKTEDCAAAALADLLTGPPRHRSFAVAGDEEQAALILDSVEGFKLRSPLLADVVVQKTVIRNVETGSELKVMSSDAPTAYGIRPRRVFFDELSLQTHERLWTSFWTSVGKNPMSQMVAVSMAGWDFASLGWRIREMATKNNRGRYYFATREGSELAPWLSPEVMDEQRDSLHPADFARYWECRWTEPKGSWITREMYEAAETGQESAVLHPSSPYAIYVDLGLVHDATAIAVCHLEGDLGSGVVVLDTLRTMQGSHSMPVDLEAVEELVAQLMRQYGCWRVVFEAPQAVSPAQRLQKQFPRAHVEARWPTAQVQAKLFGNLYHLFSARRLRIFPHEQLRKEALNLVTKTVAGLMKVVDSAAIHQDHVIALGGAAELVLTPDMYTTSMGYFASRNADEEHQKLADDYLAALNSVDVDAYLNFAGNSDDPTLAAAIRTSPPPGGM